MDARPHAEWWRADAQWWKPDAAWWKADVVADIGDRPGTPIPAGSPGRGSAVPFWGLMAFTFILLLAPQSYVPALAPVRPALVTAGAAITVLLFDRFTRGEPIMLPRWEIWITAGLGGWAILTVPLSLWPGGSVSFLLAIYLKTLAIFWLLTCTVNSLSRLRQVAWGLTLMAAPVAVVSIHKYLSGAFIPGEAVTRILGYEAPLSENPNDLALLLNLLLPLGVALFLGTRRAGLRLVLLAFMALDCMAVIMTFSRAGFVTLGSTFLFYTWKLFRRGQYGWLLGGLLLAMVSLPFLPASYLNRLYTITHIEADPTGSAQARWADTAAAVTWILRHPLIGAGVGMDVLALNEIRGPAWKQIHNVYLEYAVDLGFLGTVLFVTLLIACLRSAIWAQRQAEGIPRLQGFFFLAEAIQISLVAFAVAGLFHPVAYQFFFYYIAGLAVALRPVLEAETGTPDRPRSLSSGPPGG